MKKIFLFLSFVLTWLISYTQIDTSYCEESKLKYEHIIYNDYNRIIYSKPSIIIDYFSLSSQIDTVYRIIIKNDTINRLKDNELKDFEEILPLIGIKEWKLLVKSNEIFPFKERELKYKNIKSAYRLIEPHLYGRFSNDIAIIRTEKGYNFINRRGKILFSNFFENATNFIDGVANVKLNGDWCKLYPNGKLIK
jgi:hypothetical protein